MTPESGTSVHLGLAGWEATAIVLDSGVQILFGLKHEYTLRIERTFTVQVGPSDPTEVAFAPYEPDAPAPHGIDALARIVHTVVQQAEAHQDGSLRVAFARDLLLHVPPGEGYEAWMLTGPSGTLLVSLPSGGLG
jgi:hypothetical protein